MRYCIFCGVDIPMDAKFCQICGKEQPELAADVADSVVDGEETGSPEETPVQETFLARLLANPMKLVLFGAILLPVVIGALTFVVVMMLHK
ncbi:MAG: zinc ribbon domain-containing protein [Negativicutes bacterium]|nr:zinc ribbon domain-containing protein [Negativicutes bacterium]